MFERFTKEARADVVDAQQVARELRSPTIDTRHLLVVLAAGDGPASGALRTAGLEPEAVADAARRAISSGEPLDADALASLGVDLAEIRRQTDRTFGEGALDRAGSARPRRSGAHVPFTSDAKKALELALREAVRLRSKGIDGGHLLLGLVRADCPGGRVLEGALRDVGATVPDLRAAVEQARRTA